MKENDYDKKIETLIENIRKLHNGLQSLKKKKDFELEIDEIEKSLIRISSDIESMRRSASPQNKKDVFEEGLRRMRELKFELIDDGLREKLEEEVGSDLESWG
jgi:hypothetical protein